VKKITKSTNKVLFVVALAIGSHFTSHDKKLVTIEVQINSGTKDTCEVEIGKSLNEIFVKTQKELVYFFR